MRSNGMPDRDGVAAVLDRFEASAAEVAALPLDALTPREQLAVLERMEKVRRQLPAVEHEAINQLAEHAAPGEIGGRLSHVMADRLRITRAEAGRRIQDAEVLGSRTSFTGESLPPAWPATAAAQAAGEIGVGHIAEIRRFFKQLPGWVDEPTKERAERDLAKLAGEYRPDELRRAANHMADCINPDGDFDDEYRAQRRGLTIGKQGEDGMSPVSGWLTPQLRANLDAALNKWAAPGMCNPADASPTVAGTPSEEAIAADDRTTAQRNHDGLNAMCRNLLASGELGQHHGLPAALIVTTTLQELQSAAGKATTATGSWLPMREVIRLASHAHHYLAVFDQHTDRTLYLAHTKRIANPDQRIVLFAKEGGCTAPGCTVPASRCEVHHIDPWARTGRTHIDDLTLACGSNHKLVDEGWKTRKRADGTTEWIPPPHLDHGQSRVNDYHHPERYFRRLDEEEDDSG